MVKIKYSVRNKNTLLNKTNELVDDFSSIKNYYSDISIPGDLGESNKLTYISNLFSSIKNDANLVDEMLEDCTYELEDIQSDLLSVISDISTDNLLLFNNELYEKSDLMKKTN